MASSSTFIFWAALTVYVLCCPGVLSNTESVPSFTNCTTCTDEPKNVTLRVLNVLKPPHMYMIQHVNNTYQKYLLGVMQEAATINKKFRFSATYYDLTLGFYLDAYNFVYANYTLDKSFWLILGGDMKPVRKGISSYVPIDGELVTFKLTSDKK